MRFVGEKQLAMVLEGGRMGWYVIKGKKLVEREILQIKIKDYEQMRSAEICVFMEQKEMVYVFFTTSSAAATDKTSAGKTSHSSLASASSSSSTSSLHLL